jgi:uncharacterized protein involved in exopolysaccharide biosynthesis
MVTTTSRKESTVKDFLDVIFRRKWIILGIVLVATSVVVVLNMREPAIYESSAKMLVKRGESEGIFTRGITVLGWEEEIASQIEMVKSQIVMRRAQEIIGNYLPESYETAEKINTARVGAGVISTSNVIWVSYTSGDPIFCEAAVNAVSNSYKEHYQKVRTPPEMEDFFSRELQNLKSEIEYWRDRSEEVERKWGILDIELQSRNTLERFEKYKVDLNEIIAEKREMQSVIKRLETFQTMNIEEQSAISEGLVAGNRETLIENLRRSLLELRMKESMLSASLTDQNKELKDVRKQISDLHVMMDREIKSLILVKRNQLAIIDTREQTLRDIIDDLEGETEVLPKRKIEIARIQSALGRLELNYSELMQQHLSTKITIASNPEWTVTILNPATPAYQKKTRDYVRIALGPIFSLVVALGFAFFVDNLDHSIKNISEAEEVFDLHVLASFPDKSKK